MKRTRTTHFSKRGMALIELIIAMTILATLATIAIITADDLGEITRYEETERRGNAIQKGVVGNDGEVSRFANDMGRFPMILLNPTDDTDRKKFLAELYDLVDKDGDIYSYDNAQRMKKRECTLSVDLTKIESATATTADVASDKLPKQIKMSAGWDGPYVLNQNSADELTDNWGHYWDIFHESATLTDAGGNAVEKWAKNLDGDVYPNDTTDELSFANQTEILGVRSWYKDEYKDELAFLFPKNRLFVSDLQVELVDASGNPLNSANYSTVKIFVYLPYCPPKRVADGNNTATENFPEPQIAEFCIWKNTTSDANGFRLRVDANFDGTITDSDENEYIRAADKIPHLIRTRVDLGSAFSSFTLKDFPVGTRKIWAYAKTSGNTGIFAPVRAYEIKPSTGVLKIYLNETF